MKTVLALSLLISAVALVIALRLLRPDADALQLSSLRLDLGNAQTKLRDSELKLAEVLPRLAELEKKYATLSHPVSSVTPKKVATPTLPILSSGSCTVESSALVYSSDAKLRVGSEVLVTSPTGVMVSDLEQKKIFGDLTMEAPKGTIRANEAIVDVRKKTMTGKTMTVTFKKKPNKVPE